MFYGNNNKEERMTNVMDLAMDKTLFFKRPRKETIDKWIDNAVAARKKVASPRLPPPPTPPPPHPPQPP